MADFFTRLAERTLGVAPVIQPLTAPMFAPGPTLKDNFTPDAEQEEGSSALASLSGESPVAWHRFPSRSSETETGRGEELSRPQYRQRLLAPLAQETKEDMRGAPDSHDRGIFLPVPPEPRSRLRELPGFPALSQRRVLPARVVQQEQRERPSPLRSGRELSRLSPPPQEEEDVAFHARGEQFARGTIPAGFSRRLGESGMPAPLPAIRVTIGRIEVRAVTPPLPPTPRPAPTRSDSSLSLGEYLKQQSRGRR